MLRINKEFIVGIAIGAILSGSLVLSVFYSSTQKHNALWVETYSEVKRSHAEIVELKELCGVECENIK